MNGLKTPHSLAWNTLHNEPLATQLAMFRQASAQINARHAGNFSLKGKRRPFGRTAQDNHRAYADHYPLCTNLRMSLPGNR